MKRRVVAIAVFAFLLGICLPKQRLQLWAALNLGWDTGTVEAAIGRTPFAFSQRDAEFQLSLLSAQERSILQGPHIELWERLAADSDLMRAVGYPVGDSVQWLLIDRGGRVRAQYSLPTPRNERC